MKADLTAAAAFAVMLLIGAPSVQATNPVPARFLTPNGTTVLVLTRDSLPIVAISILVRAGSIHETDEKAGLANLVASLLDEGTTRFGASELAEALDFMGAKLSISATSDATTVSLRVLKKDLEPAMEILAEILRRPTFPEKELERVRRLILGGIVAAKDNPGDIAQKAFDGLVFGAHPYHRPVEGLEETLPRIDRAAIVGFHDGYYRPNNLIVAAVGDVTEGEFRELMSRLFGDWEKKPIPQSDPGRSTTTQGRDSRIIDRNLSQATVVLGHSGIARNDPDYYAVTVMNYILGGGGFSSRLLKRIRDSEGLVYGIYSAFDARVEPGSFSVSFQTKNASAGVAVNGVTEEIERIRTKPVTERELSETKSYLIGSFPLRLETTARIAGLLTQIEFLGLGLTYFDDYPAGIRAVTRDDVLRVAQKHLHPDRMSLVAVGRESEMNLALGAPAVSK